MLTITKGDVEIKIHDSIKKIKIDRFNAFKKFVQIDAGLGSDLGTFDHKMSRVYQFLSEDKKDFAMEEVNNIRLHLWQKMTQMNPKYLSFGCLVESIDGETFDGFDDVSEVQVIIDQLAKLGLTEGDVRDTLEDVKKNFLEV